MLFAMSLSEVANNTQTDENTFMQGYGHGRRVRRQGRDGRRSDDEDAAACQRDARRQGGWHVGRGNDENERRHANEDQRRDVVYPKKAGARLYLAPCVSKYAEQVTNLLLLVI